jgi:hypothetical protein
LDSPDPALGEPAQAPHPDSDDGWRLTFATHRATGGSRLTTTGGTSMSGILVDSCSSLLPA